ncbi:hypothetical protein BaRGS_00008793, partial [Batillaria attramentaria]
MWISGTGKVCGHFNPVTPVVSTGVKGAWLVWTHSSVSCAVTLFTEAGEPAARARSSDGVHRIRSRHVPRLMTLIVDSRRPLGIELAALTTKGEQESHCGLTRLFHEAVVWIERQRGIGLSRTALAV